MIDADIIKNKVQQYYNRVHNLEQVSDKKENGFEEMKRFQQRVLNLLKTHKVPYSTKEDEDTYEDYLLSDDENAAKTNGKNKKKQLRNKEADSSEDENVDERIASIKNKLRQKKRPTTEKQQKRREAKKLKRSKGVQKILQSSGKSLKNENVKQQKLKNGFVKMEKNVNGETEDSKEQIQPVKVQPVYNEEAKIVYSKIDFAANPGTKAKKSHQNPKEILKKLKDTRQHINELKEQGDTEKAAEIQNDIAWKKAFDKIEGKKVKDDTKLLQKAIKKRKVEKRVAKKKWTDRKEKVEHDIAKRQKKRQENLDKRSKDKKIKKLKKASKKGRIIAGY
ncbi:surfeit locus protein 6 homolog [Drosophila sulfurigaster albostrigata]|uniref:surfeit locus protein 6 homolog n=1 Tax=Drosophila sulfurigaster albostrigata TaxID=89887 RepID=UPI002D21DE7A|nr:surfeit locus protein 6 homolog [Drosophila sulfurigaster albostrigata]